VLKWDTFTGMSLFNNMMFRRFRVRRRARCDCDRRDTTRVNLWCFFLSNSNPAGSVNSTKLYYSLVPCLVFRLPSVKSSSTPQSSRHALLRRQLLTCGPKNRASLSVMMVGALRVRVNAPATTPVRPQDWLWKCAYRTRYVSCTE